MKRLGPVIGVIVLLGVVLAPFLCVEEVWDGSFKLSATLRSRSSQPIKHVSCAFAFHREEAQWRSNSNDLEAESSFKAAEEFDGATVVAYGQCSGRKWLGIEHGYGADQFVVLRIGYANGKQSTVVAEIPKTRGPRNIEVDVP